MVKHVILSQILKFYCEYFNVHLHLKMRRIMSSVKFWSNLQSNLIYLWKDVITLTRDRFRYVWTLKFGKPLILHSDYRYLVKISVLSSKFCRSGLSVIYTIDFHQIFETSIASLPGRLTVRCRKYQSSFTDLLVTR